MKLPHLPRIPRLSWPRRKRAATPAPGAELTPVLRAFQTAALWGIGIMTATADGAAFTESYRGLFEWAEHHDLTGFWAAAFPFQVDLFIVIGELVLFVAMVGRWHWKDRLGAWAVALLGLAVSIAGNVGHVAATDLQSRGTAAVPPVAAFGALWLGLGVLKRILRNRARPVPVATETMPAVTAGSVPGGEFTAVLGELAGAVRALAERPAPEAPQPAARTDETVLLTELTGVVRDLGERIGGMVSSPVPVSAEHAAMIAYQATTAAGNPLSGNALMAKFGLTRAQVQRVRAEVPEETDIQPAPELVGSLNGSGPGNEGEPSQ